MILKILKKLIEGMIIINHLINMIMFKKLINIINFY